MGKSRYVDGLFITTGERPNEWIITGNGNEHVIYFEKSEKRKDCKLFVDGEEEYIPLTLMKKYWGIDHVVQIEGRPIYCVYNGREFDIAIRGRYINNEEIHYHLGKSFFLIPIVVFLFIAEFALIKIDAPNGHHQLALLLMGGLIIYPSYLHCLYLKEKAGKYKIVDEKENKRKKFMRRIYVITFLSIALLVAAVIMQNKGMPMVIWLPMMIIFMVNGRYVAHLFKKQNETKKQE